MSDKIKKSKDKSSKKDLLKGSNLIEMLNHLMSHLAMPQPDMPSALKMIPLGHEINDEDFDDTDPVISKFKDMDGCQGVMRIIKLEPSQAIERLSNNIMELQNIRKASNLINIRKAFEAIKDFSFENSGSEQLKAVKLLDELYNNSENEQEKFAFAKAKRAVLAGNAEYIDAAAYRLQNVFANNVKNTNTRLAFIESGRTPEGVPYLKCPKARHQLGNAIDMPITSCRDNCIDSRTTQDGKVTCAYQDWLKTAADNHINVIARLDEMHPEDNQTNRLNLKDGERFNPSSLAIDTMTFEARMEEKLKQIKSKTKPINENIEGRLEDPKLLTGHQGLVGEGNMEDRLRKPVVASRSGIDPDEEINFGAQLEAKRDKLFVEKPIDERLEDASESNLGRHGEQKERAQDMNRAAWNLTKNTKVSPESDDTLGKQVSTRHESDEKADKTLSELLADAEFYYDDDEMEALCSTLEELLSEHHKGL